MSSDSVELFLTLCEIGTLEELNSKIQLNDSLLLEHNNSGDTPLTITIINNKFDIFKYLIENGAYKSIFVKGKLPNTLLCTLPFTIKSLHGTKVPPLINYQNSITSTSKLLQQNININSQYKEMIELIDEHLSNYIKYLATKKFEEAADNAAKGVVNNGANSQDNSSSSSAAAAAKSSTKTSSQTAVPPSPFAAGDLVRLINTETFDNKTVYDLNCLSYPNSGHLGLVVNAVHKNKKGEEKSGTEPDWIISIAGCLLNSTINGYATSELCYADGSSRGAFEGSLSAKPGGKYDVGVKVKLTEEKWDSGNLQNKKGDSFIGTINRKFPGYSDAWYVTVTDPRAGTTNGAESGYYESSLIILSDSLPLGVGDRVILSEDGLKKDPIWSMSNDSSGTNKVGVVLFIPPIENDTSTSSTSSSSSSSASSSTSSSSNRRLIYVAPIDDVPPFQRYEDKDYSTFYLYKSSWLERAPPVGSDFYQSSDNVLSTFSKFFKPGDRVQLNHATWLPNSIKD